MLLIPIIAAATIGGAPASMPMHAFSAPVIAAPAPPRPISAPPAAPARLKPPPLAPKMPQARTPEPPLAWREQRPAQCFVDLNEAGVGEVVGIGLAPVAGAMVCPPPLPIPPLLPF
ncbi:MAG TPA: hypothetical protein VMG98_01665 [Verrucomicrobiae bacterium]|nr:hypothetical protein [Verrucomicrobiae bacterium]